MGLFDKIGVMMRRKMHERDIARSLETYRQFSGKSPAVKQAYSDSGTFRSQVERLFALGNQGETDVLKSIAESTVATTLTNRYYRAADYLSDIVDDLERRTYLTGEASGEPALTSDIEPYERELKLKAITGAWLSPLKVASVEAVVGAHAKAIGRSLAYAEMQRFERSAARIFSLLTDAELTFVEQRVRGLVEGWSSAAEPNRRFDSPGEAVSEAVACLCGEVEPEGASGLRPRHPSQPLRLSTVVPEERQLYLEASFARWEPSA